MTRKLTHAAKIASLASLLLGVLAAAPAQAKFVVSYPAPGAEMRFYENGKDLPGGAGHLIGSSGRWTSTRPLDMDAAYFDGDPGDPCQFDRQTNTMTCNVPPSNVVVRGGDGIDRFHLSTSSDTSIPLDVDVGGGNDHVGVGGHGHRETVKGGPGDDTLTVNFTSGIPTETDASWRVDLSGGTAWPMGSTGAAYAHTGFENIEQYIGGNSRSGHHTLVGDDGPNRISGSGRLNDPATGQPYPGTKGNDTIDGRGGDDLLRGYGGNDIITGGPGADAIECGPGEDTVTDPEPHDRIAADCEGAFTMKLDAVGDKDGDRFFSVVMELQNQGDNPVKDIKFEYPEILRAGNQGFPAVQQGEVVRIGGPEPALPSRLGVNETSKHVFHFRFVEERPGRSAIFTEAIAVDEKTGDAVRDPHTVIVDSEATAPGYRRASFAMALIDNWVIQAFKVHMEQSRADGLRIYEIGRKSMSAKERRKWFGDAKKLIITKAERALADAYGVAPEFAAAITMNAKFDRVPSQEKQSKAFWAGMREEAWNQTKPLIDGVKKTGTATLKAGKDSAIESVMLTKYMLGKATPEERAQIEVMAIAFLEQGLVENRLEEGAKRSLAFMGNRLLHGPTQEEVDKNWQDLTLNSADLQAQLRQDAIKKANVEAIFDRDPLKAQKEMGKLTMDHMFPWIKLGGEVIVGGGTEKLGSLVMTKMAGTARLAKATGVVDDAGKVTKNGNKVVPSDTPAGRRRPSSPPLAPSPARRWRSSSTSAASPCARPRSSARSSPRSRRSWARSSARRSSTSRSSHRATCASRTRLRSTRSSRRRPASPSTCSWA
jgi:hypothetical protein